MCSNLDQFGSFHCLSASSSIFKLVKERWTGFSSVLLSHHLQSSYKGAMLFWVIKMKISNPFYVFWVAVRRILGGLRSRHPSTVEKQTGRNLWRFILYVLDTMNISRYLNPKTGLGTHVYGPQNTNKEKLPEFPVWSMIQTLTPKLLKW